MNEKLEKLLKEDPELENAYLSDIANAEAAGEKKATAAKGKVKTKAQALKDKAPDKPKCIGKYPKEQEKIEAQKCRVCFWAQVCKKKIKEDDHLKKMFG